ncbi:Rpp14/Pop5 family-domain-containing protein [Stachybotrys elegans]|uniref:Ribonuclease P/MRP protein subunit POP5 n=1 Tax=Stachybotrys elegans TaxID=80388 RepID=A0A8K0T0F2_9HYPO|nr:Rpp14/Pop5 family-domain-containing protein [Stachybotrys elegans]
MVRIKGRYLLVNIIYPPDPEKLAKTDVPDIVFNHQPTVENLTPQALLRAIRSEVATLYGDYGAGAMEGHLSVKYLSLATSTFILRCSRSAFRMLWSALTFMDRVPVKDGRPCIFRVVRVSGTIRKVEQEAIRQAKQLILAAKGESASINSFIADMAREPDHVMADTAGNSDSDDDMSLGDG